MTRTAYNTARRLLRSLRQGLWFRPLLWILGTLVVSAAAYAVGTALPDGHPLLPAVRAETAQSLLELLAGTMLTIATVAFSMVLVVMTFVSGQLSPRSIPGVLRDAAIQDALGVFLAGLVFGLGGMLAFETLGTWPNGPVITVLLSSLVCALTVIYLMGLIHHVSRRVQVGEILAQQRDLAEAGIDHFFGRAPPGQALSAAPGPLPEAAPEALPAPRSGYLQVLNLHDIHDVAVQNDLLVRVLYSEGDYVGRGWTMFEVWPAGAAGEAAREALAGAAQVGIGRTPEGDPLFPLEVMGEIGERALSPGVNDTGTALAALDHLAGCLLHWAAHPAPSPWIADEAGRLRVVIGPPRLELALERTVARLLRCGAGNPEVERKVLWLADRLLCEGRPEAGARQAIEELRRRAAGGLDGAAAPGGAPAAAPLPLIRRDRQ